MAKKLSVIVPVCNVEKYLRQCVESILKQPINELEVLCINDGSTDASLQILRELQKEDDRVLVIDKTNSGYGDSVNIGIDTVTGDYISIIESDDIVVDGSLALLLEKAEQEDADVVKGNYLLFWNEEKTILHENFKGCKYNQITNARVDEKLFLTAPAIWSGIYKREFLLNNHIYCIPSPGASYQDTSFAFKVWVCASRIVLLEKPIIYYRQDNVASSSNNDKKVFDIFRETEEMKSFLIRNKMLELLPICMRTKFQSYTWTLNRLSAESKVKFMLKVFYDMRVDVYQGNLIRKYWDDELWNLVFNMIFNISDVCKNVLGQSTMREVGQVQDLLRMIENVYIWEEKQDEGLKNFLQENGVNIEAELSINSEGKLIKIKNGDTIDLASADREKLIVLQAGRECIAEIIENLNKNFMCNYIEIDC